MPSYRIDDERIQQLNDCDCADGNYTLYWMQQSQRSEFNHALEFAVQQANKKAERLLVAFALSESYPGANERHFQFMLQGLQEIAKSLRRRKIKFVLMLGDPPQVISKLAEDASQVVCDRGYLRHQVDWRQQVARNSSCRVWQVESEAIVPVEVASNKREYAARTIRAQINERADSYLRDFNAGPVDHLFVNRGALEVGFTGFGQITEWIFRRRIVSGSFVRVALSEWSSCGTAVPAVKQLTKGRPRRDGGYSRFSSTNETTSSAT